MPAYLTSFISLASAVMIFGRCVLDRPLRSPPARTRHWPHLPTRRGKPGTPIRFQNGREISNFVYNLTTNKQENITNGAVAADKLVSTRYPLAKLAGLGDTFGWSGTVTVDGVDVDRCPGGEAKTQFPNG